MEFQGTYNDRKNEIEEFLELLEFLEQKEKDKTGGTSEFDKFFHEKNGIKMTYQSLINILKSNVSLMIYNIIEFTVTNLIDSIYDELEIHGLTYTDVNDSIRTIWKNTILKGVNDPNASFNTFIRKNDEIIDRIINNHVLKLRARDTLPNGNLDGRSIKIVFESHGVQIDTTSENFRPDILDTIKNNRNNLSHGQVSFVEAVRTETIQDIRVDNDFVIKFLDELIDEVTEYINKQNYKTYSKDT